MKSINPNLLHVTNHFHMFVTHTHTVDQCAQYLLILSIWTTLNWKIHCCDK